MVPCTVSPALSLTQVISQSCASFPPVKCAGVGTARSCERAGAGRHQVTCKDQRGPRMDTQSRAGNTGFILSPCSKQ